MSMFYLKVTSKGVVFEYYHAGHAADSKIINSVAEAHAHHAYLASKYGEQVTMCSSTMDWPRDVTNNRRIIKLAHELRSPPPC